MRKIIELVLSAAMFAGVLSAGAGGVAFAAEDCGSVYLGGVPLGIIEVDALNAHDIGELIYFFWKACAVSGYLLSVNPFDQPGVESYKKNMFALLGKPGYEDRKAELEAKLQD